MQAQLILRDVFRVIAAGPWEPSDFGRVEVELRATKTDAFFPPRLLVRVREAESPAINFEAEGYRYEAGVLRLWTGARLQWVFRALD